jgi:hypothetical protein
MRSLMRPALLMALLAGLMVFSAGPATYGDVVLQWDTMYAPVMQSMPPDQPIMYAAGMGILVKNVLMVDQTPRHNVPPPGMNFTRQSFFDISTEVSFDGGGTFLPFYAPGVPGWIRATGLRPPPYYDADLEEEMIGLDISGGTLPSYVMIRESPTLASAGHTMIQDLGWGYNVDSFFDVFTEITVDGGNTWYPASAPLHMVGAPEPATLTLLLLGGLCAMGYAWRRSKR